MSFYLCDNPCEEMPGAVEAYVYASEQPRFFGILMKLEAGLRVSEISYSGATVIFRYFVPGEGELAHYLLMVRDNIDKARYEELSEKLKAAVEWFMSIVAQEASVAKVAHMFLDPFAPGLEPAQVIQFGQGGDYLLNFGTGAKGFTSLEALLKFMNKELGIARDRLDWEQMINIIT